MIGDRVRTLREARGWTQAHLAEASGVSLRTIQRLERLHSCSAETRMALAAALGVDSRELWSEPDRQPASRRLWPWLTPKRASAWGGLLALPLLVFVAVNLLKFGAGIAAPYDSLAAVGDRLGLVSLFDRLSPLLFLGGGVTAVLLTAAAQVRARTESEAGAVLVAAVGLRLDARSLAALLLALAALASLAAYLVGENLPDLVRAASA